MKCLILAAGYATRLYPLTENFPKPLLEVGGKTILDWLLEDLCGLTGGDPGAVVVTNRRYAPHFRAWAAEKSCPVAVADDGTEANETRLGAVRDILFAVDALGLDDDLLILAGDNLLDFSLGAFLRYASKKGTSCTMRYREADESRLRKSGVAEIGEGGRLLSLEEKPAEPRSHWCTPPFYYYRREDARRIREAVADGCAVDAPGSLAAWMCRHTPMYSMEMPGRRWDIGDIQSYEEARRSYRGRRK